MVQRVWIALGSNIGNRISNLKVARERISIISESIVNTSSIYETEPWGYQSSFGFYNQCLEIACLPDPELLLSSCKEIEKSMGRTNKGSGYQDRIIDIDILFYGNEILDLPQLILPHPEITMRRFVLEPLNEIAPELLHPVLKRTINDLLSECDDPLKVKRLSLK